MGILCWHGTAAPMVRLNAHEMLGIQDPAKFAGLQSGMECSCHTMGTSHATCSLLHASMRQAIRQQRDAAAAGCMPALDLESRVWA